MSRRQVRRTRTHIQRCREFERLREYTEEYDADDSFDIHDVIGIQKMVTYLESEIVKEYGQDHVNFLNWFMDIAMCCVNSWEDDNGKHFHADMTMLKVEEEV